MKCRECGRPAKLWFEQTGWFCSEACHDAFLKGGTEREQEALTIGREFLRRFAVIVFNIKGYRAIPGWKHQYEVVCEILGEPKKEAAAP